MISAALVLMAVLILGLAVPPAMASGFFSLPPLPLPYEYGNILIDQNASRNGVKPVAFSHWVHRQKFTCVVCHMELGFSMQTNDTDISEAEIRDGQYCGACHNQKVAFGIDGNCAKCHRGDVTAGSEKFSALSRKGFPSAPYGNGIDWVQSLERGLINPARFLQTEVKDIAFERTLLLEAEWAAISPAIFSHRVHDGWMGCNMCHPELFNIKKKTTKHFLMVEILKGNFCGACHMKVAFPMDDCQRCHPGMEPL